MQNRVQKGHTLHPAAEFPCLPDFPSLEKQIPVSVGVFRVVDHSQIIRCKEGHIHRFKGYKYISCIRILRQMPIRKVEGELLTDCFRPHGLPVPGCVYLRTAHYSWDSFFHRHSDYMPNGLAMVDYNHFCSDYRTFVNHGIKSRLADIQEARVTFAADAEKLAFLDGIEVVLDAIRELCERYGQRVPYEPSSTFGEAVQAVWFTFLLTPDSVGRLDSVLYPFYKREKEAGTLTDEMAEEYIAELLIKIFAYTGSAHHKSGDTTMVVGGWEMGPDGTLHDGFTELSRLILKVRTELPIWRPQVRTKMGFPLI